MRIRRPLRLLLPTALLAASSLAGAGCYSYVPTRLETLPPGSSVRMEITGVAVDRLRPMRFTASPNVEGIMVQRDGDRLEVDALIRTVDAVGITAIHTQRLTLDQDEVRAVSFRRLDTLKTGIAVGGVGVALGGTLYILFRGSLGSTTDYQPPVDFAPALRFRIPLGATR